MSLKSTEDYRVVSKLAERAFKNHTLVVVGLYDENKNLVGRQCRCFNPKKSAYQFEVLFFGSLVYITGDLGDITFKCHEDSFQWLTKTIPASGWEEYLLGKIVASGTSRSQSFCGKEFSKQVKLCFEESDEYEGPLSYETLRYRAGLTAKRYSREDSKENLLLNKKSYKVWRKKVTQTIFNSANEAEDALAEGLVEDIHQLVSLAYTFKADLVWFLFALEKLVDCLQRQTVGR